MRMLLAGIMLLHGLAHGVGFAGSWHLSKDIPYKTTIFGGSVELGDAGMKLFGVLWLLAALSFVVSAMSALANHPLWPYAAFAATLFSIALCLTEVPETRIGLDLNAALLIVLIAVWWRTRATLA
jgi:hypothetical protein